jgi:hypothetical protein
VTQTTAPAAPAELVTIFAARLDLDGRAGLAGALVAAAG